MESCKSLDGLDHAVELLAGAVLQRCFAQAARPIGGILASFDQLDRCQCLVEFRQPPAVGIGIAFHEASALQDLDTELVVGGNRVGCGLEPSVPMRGLDGVTQRAASQAAYPPTT